ncbi:MAG: T9SS type A sorting domain-containing protein, partial [Bacteroidales bacterium]|nr:T9SS type A sorting domain-containing protein [Bacteroidales bacterium]MBN2818696.1 T9SS type A sorting domain-containing protein [Bacteroidales bacterium]
WWTLARIAGWDGTQSGEIDSEPPTAPGNLTANASSENEISLNWDASTDNVGVSFYRIFRDDSQVGTSVTTSYVDGGLNPNTEYSYYVVATDASGNLSSASNTITVETGNATTSVIKTNAESIRVFPNPCAHELTIILPVKISETADLKFMLYSLQGEVIYFRDVNFSFGSVQPIKLSEIQSGMYIYKIIANDQIFQSGTIIKQ